MSDRKQLIEQWYKDRKSLDDAEAKYEAAKVRCRKSESALAESILSVPADAKKAIVVNGARYFAKKGRAAVEATDKRKARAAEGPTMAREVSREELA